MSWVIFVLNILAVGTGVLMTFLILLQEGKGGGLAALGGTKAAGVEGVTNPVRRATAYLAIVFFILLVTLGIMHRPEKSLLNGKFNTPVADTKAGEMKAEAPAAPGAPAAEAPKTVELPKINATAVPEAPKTDAPKVEAPKTEAPKAEAPKTEAPKAEAPKADAAKADAPKTDAPKVDEAKK